MLVPTRATIVTVRSLSASSPFLLFFFSLRLYTYSLNLGHFWTCLGTCQACSHLLCSLRVIEHINFEIETISFLRISIRSTILLSFGGFCVFGSRLFTLHLSSLSDKRNPFHKCISTDHYKTTRRLRSNLHTKQREQRYAQSVDDITLFQYHLVP